LALLAVLAVADGCTSPAGETATSDRLPPFRILVLSGGAGASQSYPAFDYWARQLDARLTFWHTYPREWDVYHLMDSLAKKDWVEARKPLNDRALERLRELLDAEWDLIAWTAGDLPEWARGELAERVQANQAVVVFGNPSDSETDDELSRLLAACEPVPDAAGIPRADQLRASPPPRKPQRGRGNVQAARWQRDPASSPLGGEAG
jgi:hypothetical protein